LTLATGVGFGLAPAWQLSHANPNDALKNARPSVRTLFGRFHVSDLLVLVQVALAVMLLVGAGLLIRSLQRLAAVPTGIQPDRVLSLRVSTPPAAAMTNDPGAFIRFHETVLERVKAMGEIEASAFASSLPFTWNVSSNSFFRPDRPMPLPGKFPSTNLHVVTLDYFRAMGIPLVKGELFDGHEPRPPVPDGQPIKMADLPKIYRGFLVSAVISRKMAEQFWPDEDPIGKTFQVGLPEMNLPQMKVIGVVGNTTQTGAENGEPVEYYTLLSQWPATMSLHLVVRTRQEPSGVVAALRKVIHEIVPDEPIFDVKLMSERITNFSSDRRFSMGLFSFFAGTALLLASVGIYGVLACLVGQRTREIGIRVALGANARTMVTQIFRRPVTQVSIGVLLGSILAGLLMLTEMGGGKISVMGVGLMALYGTLILAVCLLACVVPTRRALSVQPMEALRVE